jgi:hypothetical protein
MFSVAEQLAGKGADVIMATRGQALGSELPFESRGPWLRRIGSHCSAIARGCDVMEVSDGVAQLLDVELTVLRGEPVAEPVEVALVVECGRRRSSVALPPPEDAPFTVTYVGDRLSPRDISRAVMEGQRTARSI